MVKVVISVLLFATFAGAQIEGNPANWCREGFFTRDSETFRVAAVKGGRNARVPIEAALNNRSSRAA